MRGDFSIIISLPVGVVPVIVAAVSNFLFARAGTTIRYACKKGLKPESPNQDDFFVLQVDGTIGLYGVFDGHGPCGHDISHFAHQLLPALFLRDATRETDPKEALRKAFVRTHAQAQKAQERNIFDCSLSGTTGTVVYLQESESTLYVAHVGDSRCVMGVDTSEDGEGGSRNGAATIKAVDMTKDHKPGLPEEKSRIYKAGGQVGIRQNELVRILWYHWRRPG